MTPLDLIARGLLTVVIVAALFGVGATLANHLDQWRLYHRLVRANSQRRMRGMSQEPVRVFVGCAPDGLDAESLAVLEYTIRKHASLPVEITWMMQSPDPASPFGGWNTSAWATPFSAFRWAVPELCGFAGRGLYMDSDVIVLADLAELWRQDFQPGKVVLAKGGAQAWRYCVSLWDCAAMRDHLPPIAAMKRDAGTHRTLCRFFAQSQKLVQGFAGNWNCLDGEQYADLADPDIKILTTTSMPHQPHLRLALPRLRAAGRQHWFKGKPALHWRPDVIALFDRLLAEAEAAGFKVENYLPEADRAATALQIAGGRGLDGRHRPSGVEG